MTLGMDVRIAFVQARWEELTLHNVTEIHYNYRHAPYLKPPEPGSALDVVMVAFESDVHGTGVTYPMDWIKEFEAIAATEKAEAF